MIEEPPTRVKNKREGASSEHRCKGVNMPLCEWVRGRRGGGERGAREKGVRRKGEGEPAATIKATCFTSNNPDEKRSLLRPTGERRGRSMGGGSRTSRKEEVEKGNNIKAKMEKRKTRAQEPRQR